MRKVLLIVSVAIFASVAWAPSPGAGPAWGKNKSKFKYKYKGDYEVGPFGKMVARATGAPFWPKGGPPPWAPAHGYRWKTGSAAAYAPPYGIGSGKCNRSEIGALLGDADGLAAGKVTGKTAAAIVMIPTTLLGIPSALTHTPVNLAIMGTPFLDVMDQVTGSGAVITVGLIGAALISWRLPRDRLIASMNNHTRKIGPVVLSEDGIIRVGRFVPIVAIVAVVVALIF